jgi:hypothetical protein
MTLPQLDGRPFQAIPSGLARRLRPYMGRAADGLVRELLRPAPHGAPRVDESQAAGVRADFVDWLEHFYDLIEDPEPAWERMISVQVATGRRMARDGQSPDEMHRAMRRSARAAWRSLTALADALDIDRATMALIADAQFSYMDAVSALVRHGYETETETSAEAARRRRSHLLNLLLTDPPPTAGEVAVAAREAQWALPRTVAAAVVHPRDTGNFQAPPALPGVLVDTSRSDPRLVVPDPDGPGRAGLLNTMLRDWVVVIGPTVSTTGVAESMRWAQDALVLARRGVIRDDDLVRCADHVPTLVIFRAEELIEGAAATRLAPLSALSPMQVQRLSETLLALLENNFNATEVGSRLHVHPQTVRYRLRHLEELFGEDLQDPHRCLEMEMILHARLAGAGTRRGGRVRSQPPGTSARSTGSGPGSSAAPVPAPS